VIETAVIPASSRIKEAKRITPKPNRESPASQPQPPLVSG
jgi:hypothetical protein